MSVELEWRGNVALVRLERAEKLNALTREMLDKLSAVFAGIEEEGSVRAVILTGAGERAFCAGTDIEELALLDAEGARRAALRGQAVCEQIENCPVPVIAAGGGCELALACHLRIAATHAEFGLPETRLGIIPGYGGTQRLPRIAGSGPALEVMLTGSQISALEAQRLGIVNRVVSPAELLPEALSLADEIGGLAPLAIRACLTAVTRGLDLPLSEGLALEAELFTKLFDTEDMREGTRAFLEKRAPIFKGK